jgi:hypothetical protein
MIDDCARAEAIAGALALHEATDAERDAYRRHLAQCSRCADELLGELEFERMGRVLAQARGDERWEPDVRGAFHRRRARSAWRFGLASIGAASVAAAACLVLLFAGRQAPASSKLAALREQALAAVRTVPIAPFSAQRAESLSVLPASGASIQITVDRQGNPTTCSVTRSSGSSSLDKQICSNALHRHYLSH